MCRPLHRAWPGVGGLQAGGPTRVETLHRQATDPGWTDLGCFGSKLYATPNIDRLLGNTSNGLLRAGKGSAYDGGVRVPLIVKWPAVTQPASFCHTPVIGTDFYPTLPALAEVPRSNEIGGGESLEPLLRQSGTLTRKAIYWHYPHYHPGGAPPYGAIRQGDFRLVEFYEDNHVELYNLKEDLAAVWTS